jgi:hypothetical protein
MNGTPIALEASDILTPAELAARLKVTINWLYEQSRNRGRNGRRPMPCLRAGRYLRYSWPDVCAWLRSEPSNTALVN